MSGRSVPPCPTPAASWCPGCGYHGVFAAIQALLRRTARGPEDSVFVCGAGCPSLLPDPLRNFVFQGASGCAATLALGVARANPALDVWTLDADGDALAHGGEALAQLLRADPDVTCLLFRDIGAGRNDRPRKTPATTLEVPGGPLVPGARAARLALGAGARFLARTHEGESKLLDMVLAAAQAHPGTGVVEILQECLARRDEPHAGNEETLTLEHGAPMIFGDDRRKGLRRTAATTCGFEVVDLRNVDDVATQIAVHDERDAGRALLLAGLPRPAFPVVTGVLYRHPDGADARPPDPLEPDLQTRRAALGRAMHDAPTWEGSGE
ncbi:thiamine pyrophosphate-dependent enzyme [Stappia stellulata]|uniref:thiamine pyrophosphate-dependent enzyme n=1 Tax=Stappia stellulata TaxID=71235 RepID=UPI000684D62D|nr:thiamine pyrophosphate-dependent enzyme [Stappia stellulata]